jgi:hypothetical protein
MLVKRPSSRQATITTIVESLQLGLGRPAGFLQLTNELAGEDTDGAERIGHGWKSGDGGRGGGTRTPNQRFWRPLLYQLSYTPVVMILFLLDDTAEAPKGALGSVGRKRLTDAYSMISVIRPAPMVRPPSRMANFWVFSMAIGTMRSMSTAMLSPGMIISTPFGRLTIPVTSVVRK